MIPRSFRPADTGPARMNSFRQAAVRYFIKIKISNT